MWRNPVTNRFEAGDGPGDGGALPQTQRGGSIHGGWDYIPTTGQDSDGKGGEVYSVADILSDAPTGPSNVGNSNDVPKG